MRIPSLLLLAGLVLYGCAPVVSASSLPSQQASQVTPSTTASAVPSPTLTASSTPSPSPTVLPTPTSPVRTGCQAGAESCLLDWPFPFHAPIFSPGNIVPDPTYRYGSTQDGAREPHHGIDLPNAFGTPVYAAGDGTVIVAGSDKETPVSPWRNFYGNVVVIQHQVPGIGEPVYTLYGHLSKVDVSTGQIVSMGEKIGEVGLSGVAVGSHLHFEVRVGENDYAPSRNPELWLQPGGGETPRNPAILAVRVARVDGTLVPTLLNVEYFSDPSQAEPTQSFPVEAYQRREKYPVNPDDVLGENFVLGNLPAGHYRVTFVYWGTLYERWIDLAPGKLTYVPFEVP